MNDMTGNDGKIVLTVIWFLGVGFVGGLGGLFLLSWNGTSVPEGLATIVSTMGGALSAILTTTRAHRTEDLTGINRDEKGLTNDDLRLTNGNGEARSEMGNPGTD